MDADKRREGGAPGAVGTGERRGEHLSLRGGECQLQLDLSGMVTGVLLLALFAPKLFMWPSWTL